MPHQRTITIPLLDAARKAHQNLLAVVETSNAGNPLSTKQVQALSTCADHLRASIEHVQNATSKIAEMKPTMSRPTARAVIQQKAGYDSYEPETWLLDALIEISKSKKPTLDENRKIICAHAESAGYQNFDPKPFIFKAIQEVQFLYQKSLFEPGCSLA